MAEGGHEQRLLKNKKNTQMTLPDLPDPSAPALTDLMRQSRLTRHWPTFAMLGGCALLWGLALWLPQGWGGVQWALLVVALTLHASLSHEILHGILFRSKRANTAIGLFQPGLCVPYLRFRALHLAHHRDADLTDPYDDPESHYLDPAVWVRLPAWSQMLLRFNNTLLGRILVGPLIGMYGFVAGDLARIRAGGHDVAVHWLAHLPGVAVTLGLVHLSSVTLWAYLLACYGALSILHIRTFLEHRAHERASGRSVIIEDRGVLALLFLNNNFHAVHHAHPQVPWYRLPGLYRAGRDRFLAMNRGYVYRSYGAVFAQYLLRVKDPVPHPLWQDRRN